MTKLIAGVDEAGRGPLAGPVVAAAVILPEHHSITGLRDSKKLSEKKREQLFNVIQQQAIAYAIAHASVQEIDEINILQASLLAMQRAVEQLPTQPDEVLIDGNRCPMLSMRSTAIIKGDSLIDAISAASILAKVTRDRYMLQLAQRFPDYGFEKHKGYPTAIHIDNIRKHGPCEHHRLTFAPVKACC
ncbi:MAG: ribonuclease HII [Legionellaceae bacterium]|nr:ribonuclease HII [Legionellaceae bacterium]